MDVRRNGGSERNGGGGNGGDSPFVPEGTAGAVPLFPEETAGDVPLFPEVDASERNGGDSPFVPEGTAGAVPLFPEHELFAAPAGSLPGIIPIDKLAMAVQTMIAPVFEQFGAILERTNQAIERIAAANSMMNARITDLEKQVRLQKPVSRSQEKYINDAIRKRARELLDGKGFAEDKKAVTKLGGAIRKSILFRYGVSSLREAPAYDYETALEQVAMWNDLMILKDVTKEARIRQMQEKAPWITGDREKAGDAL